MINENQKQFVEFMLEENALQFGSFVLKSGRHSPFFINTALFNTGNAILKLGEFYARTIHENFGENFDVIFGPAYKGIPLAVATTISFYNLFGKKIRYSSNRKEIKDHGDAGIFLGSKIASGDKVVIVEDVTTSGASIAETFPIITSEKNVNVLGLVVSINRNERGTSDKSALSEIAETYKIKTCSIVSMKDVISFLDARDFFSSEIKRALDAYYKEWGASEVVVRC